MFPQRAQNILQQYDLYGSVTFLTFVSKKLPEYILFFCKIWIITYVGKVKTVWLFSLFLYHLDIISYSFHISSLFFFRILQKTRLTLGHIFKKVELLERHSVEFKIFNYEKNSIDNLIKFVGMIKDRIQLSYGNMYFFALV